MQDPFFGFGRFKQDGFGGGQTRIIRRVYVSNDPPTQLSTLDPFLTSRFQAMLPTMEPSMNRITNRRFFDDDDDDDDDFPAPFPSKVKPPKAPRQEEYFKPPRANPPMISRGHYGDGFYPPRYDPAGANPVNVHVNLQMWPQDLQAPKQDANRNRNANSNDNSQAGPPGWGQPNPRVQVVTVDSQPGPPGWRPYNPQVHGYYNRQTGGGDYNPQVHGYYNSQTGGGQYNPQVQGGNKVDGDGKITLGPEIGNINLEGGKAGGDQTGGGNYNANSNFNERGKEG